MGPRETGWHVIELLTAAFTFLGTTYRAVASDALGHLGLSFAAIGVAAAIAVPLGATVGHLRRGAFLAINGANALRALPTIAIIVIGVVLYGVGFLNILVALVVLALPLILTNTYVGVSEVDPAMVEAARGMGLSDVQILWRVELPNAVPLIMTGIRTATVFVIATAYLGQLGGYPHTLGRVIANQSLPISQILAYSLVSVALGLAVYGLLAVVQRALTPAGLKLTTTPPSM